MPRYQPTDALQSPRFCGIRTFARLPYVTTTEEVDATVLGIPFDTGVSYRAGARFGPAAVRDASALLRPYGL
jgi:agmatinase